MTVRMLDGSTARIRPISPSDGDALVRFHDGLTNDTTRMRFFSLHPHLTPGEVERFTHVDHHDREALVALDGPDIIAVGRFDRLPGTDDAEVAFVVADGWQGEGVGTHLLEELAQRARHGRRHTVCRGHARREPSNAEGLPPLGADGRIGHGGRVVHVVLDLRLDSRSAVTFGPAV